MEINGITFNPPDVQGYSFRIGNDINNLISHYTVALEFDDDLRIEKDFAGESDAEHFLDAIKAACNNNEIAEGVTYDKAEDTISTKYLTIKVTDIDALFCENSRIYVITNNYVHHLINGGATTIDKIAVYCKHLTNIEGFYADKRKSSIYFTVKSDVANYYNVYLSVSHTLLRLKLIRDFPDAFNYYKKLRSEYQI